jgi:TRAP-type C4-dicarboxylate transport system substrate-binding protein
MKKFNLIITAGVSMLFTMGAMAKEQELKAVHAFPTSLIYTQSFLEFVDEVNEQGEGIIRIRVLGGPEVIGLSQQPDAARNGVHSSKFLCGPYS